MCRALQNVKVNKSIYDIKKKKKILNKLFMDCMAAQSSAVFKPKLISVHWFCF